MPVIIYSDYYHVFLPVMFSFCRLKLVNSGNYNVQWTTDSDLDFYW